jgi:hypothetical protein
MEDNQSHKAVPTGVVVRMDAKKVAMIEAMVKNLGNITNSCREVGIGRQTHYDWLAADEVYAKAIRDVDEVVLDFAEFKLQEIMNGVKVRNIKDKLVYDVPPNATALIFFLKTKGKKRGYVERQEITGTDGKDLAPQIIVQLPQDAERFKNTY